MIVVFLMGKSSEVIFFMDIAQQYKHVFCHHFPLIAVLKSGLLHPRCPENSAEMALGMGLCFLMLGLSVLGLGLFGGVPRAAIDSQILVWFRWGEMNRFVDKERN